MKEVEIFIGPCSKYIDKQGWTTEIPVTQINEKGYIKFSKDEQEQLLSFIRGDWCETQIIEKVFGIDFGEGLKLFDFSRTAEWNPEPLNGQKITTKFKIKDATYVAKDIYRQLTGHGTTYVKKWIKKQFDLDVKED